MPRCWDQQASFLGIKGCFWSTGPKQIWKYSAIDIGRSSVWPKGIGDGRVDLVLVRSVGKNSPIGEFAGAAPLDWLIEELSNCF
jgi:hypothetical protein